MQWIRSKNLTGETKTIASDAVDTVAEKTNTLADDGDSEATETAKKTINKTEEDAD